MVAQGCCHMVKAMAWDLRCCGEASLQRRGGRWCSWEEERRGVGCLMTQCPEPARQPAVGSKASLGPRIILLCTQAYWEAILLLATKGSQMNYFANRPGYPPSQSLLFSLPTR